MGEMCLEHAESQLTHGTPMWSHSVNGPCMVLEPGEKFVPQIHTNLIIKSGERGYDCFREDDQVRGELLGSFRSTTRQERPRPAVQVRCVCRGEGDGGSLGTEWGQADGITSAEQSGSGRPQVRLGDKAVLFC